eukprot:20392-Heterococcus_DN1.PRE.4
MQFVSQQQQTAATAAAAAKACTSFNERSVLTAYLLERVEHISDIESRAPVIIQHICADVACVSLDVRVVDASVELDLSDSNDTHNKYLQAKQLLAALTAVAERSLSEAKTLNCFLHQTAAAAQVHKRVAVLEQHSLTLGDLKGYSEGKVSSRLNTPPAYGLPSCTVEASNSRAIQRSSSQQR